jgi:hypothetical protein
VLLTAVPASAATTSTWAYDPSTRQLVSSTGGLPFSVQGGSTNDDYGTPGVRFTAAPSLATWTGSTFLAPGAADFTYRAVLAVDAVRAKSTANVFQYGLYNVHQVKLQLTATGVPMCVLNGTGGRVKIISRTPSLADGGLQHTMACWRRGSAVGVTVDGVSTSTGFALGSVTPTGQATAGNKTGGGAADQLYGTIWQVGVDIG